MNDIISANKDNEDNILKKEFVVLFFYSKWSGPCKNVLTMIKDLSKVPQYEKINFVSIDVDQENTLVKRFNLKSIPTLIGMHSNKVVFQHSGIINENNFRIDLNALFY